MRPYAIDITRVTHQSLNKKHKTNKEIKIITAQFAFAYHLNNRLKTLTYCFSCPWKLKGIFNNSKQRVILGV